MAGSLALYKYTQPSPDGSADGQPFLTRMIHKYDGIQKRVEEYNIRSIHATEAAAQDRRIFYEGERNRHVDLKFPEIFNTGSPRNVRAGHQPNLDALYKHSEEKQDEAQQKRAVKSRRAAERATEDSTSFVASVSEGLGFGGKSEK